MTKKISKKQWEKENNVLWSCSKHGKETYFNIKQQEKERGMKSFVYVWFHDADGRQEKMWVRIRSGSQTIGFGTLNNIPIVLKNIKVNDPVHYRTDRSGITRPVSKENTDA